MLNQFDPECTVPTLTSNFVNSPNIRSTLDILWSCLSILFLCTWSIQHLNIAVQIKPQNWIQGVCRQFSLVGQKLKWMFVALVAPEWTLGQAVADLLSAQRSKAEMVKFVIEADNPWTLSHAFFANMGGFVVTFPKDMSTEVITGARESLCKHPS
jgi:hypothetical protein